MLPKLLAVMIAEKPHDCRQSCVPAQTHAPASQIDRQTCQAGMGERWPEASLGYPAMSSYDVYLMYDLPSALDARVRMPLLSKSCEIYMLASARQSWPSRHDRPQLSSCRSPLNCCAADVYRTCGPCICIIVCLACCWTACV